jgi:MoaA/NifB/PqqE/SkfB family radical SAM enzyme
MYGEQANGAEANADSEDEEQDIEAEIKKELADIRKPSTKPLFASVKLDTQCCKQGVGPAFRDWDTDVHPSDILQNTRAGRARGVH